jgi:hypothetical protein
MMVAKPSMADWKYDSFGEAVRHQDSKVVAIEMNQIIRLACQLRQQVIRYDGKSNHDVGVIRGGGGARDTKRMANRQSDKIGAASNTRDQDNPPV